jgi:hypothetical protein
MGDDDCGGTVGNRVGKDFSWMNLGLVDQANGNDPGGNNLIGSVQGNTKEMFLFSVGVMTDQGRTSAGNDIFKPSGRIRRRENSMAAATSVALARPTPSIFCNSSRLTFPLLPSTTFRISSATVMTSCFFVPLPRRTANNSRSDNASAPFCWSLSRGRSDLGMSVSRFFITFSQTEFEIATPFGLAMTNTNQRAFFCHCEGEKRPKQSHNASKMMRLPRSLWSLAMTNDQSRRSSQSRGVRLGFLSLSRPLRRYLISFPNFSLGFCSLCFDPLQ